MKANEKWKRRKPGVGKGEVVIISIDGPNVTWRSSPVYVPKDGSMTADDFNQTGTVDSFRSKFQKL